MPGTARARRSARGAGRRAERARRPGRRVRRSDRARDGPAGAGDRPAFGWPSRLHDLGKVWISRDILDKPGPLTERGMGGDPAPPADRGAPVSAGGPARPGRHRRLPTTSGRTGPAIRTGFPSAEVPLEAQIVAVADVYDAMLSQRPYARPRTPEEARPSSSASRRRSSTRTSWRRSCACYGRRAQPHAWFFSSALLLPRGLIPRGSSGRLYGTRG